MKIKRKVKTYNIFSTIIEHHKLKKNGHLFDHDEINNALFKFEKTNDPLSDVLNNLEEFIHNADSLKRKSSKRKIFFDDKFLLELLECNHKSHTIKEFAEIYKLKYPNVTFSNATLRRYIKKQLGFTYKIAPIKHVKSCSQKAFEMDIVFAKKLLELINENHLLLFMDESSFSNSINGRRKWLNKRCPKPIISNTRFNSFSVMGIFDITGLLHFELKDSSYKNEDFLEFISSTEKILSDCEYYSDNLKNRKISIILDNAKIHTKKKGIKILKKSLFNFVYLPPYKPEYNISEFAWGIIKNKLRRKYFSSR